MPTNRAGIILAEAAARLPPPLRAELARLALRMAT
jgi:hypothetical protein